MDWREYIRPDYHGAAFVNFGPAHLLALAALVAFGAGMLRLRGADLATRRNARLGLALMLVVTESSWHVWVFHYVGWTLDKMLPLHICSLLVWLGAYTLVTLDVAAYEFIYFMGIAGPLQAVLTPDAGRYGLPHFRAVQTLGSHGLLIVAALYLTVVEGMRPTPRSLMRVVLGMLLYMVAVTGINLALGSNYMFTLRKPDTASMLDTFGPWPWYLVPMIGLGILNCIVLYIPFWWADRRRAIAAVTTRVSAT